MSRSVKYDIWWDQMMVAGRDRIAFEGTIPPHMKHTVVGQIKTTEGTTWDVRKHIIGGKLVYSVETNCVISLKIIDLPFVILSVVSSVGQVWVDRGLSSALLDFIIVTEGLTVISPTTFQRNLWQTVISQGKISVRTDDLTDEGLGIVWVAETKKKTLREAIRSAG